MFYLALDLADGVVLFMAGMAINFLHFLATATCLGAMATCVWILAFIGDVVLMHRLRLLQRHVKHDRHPDPSFVFPLEPDFRFFVNEIRDTIFLYLACDWITAEWTTEILDNTLPAKK